MEENKYKKINTALLSICEDILSEDFTKEQIVDEIMTLYHELNMLEGYYDIWCWKMDC